MHISSWTVPASSTIFLLIRNVFTSWFTCVLCIQSTVFPGKSKILRWQTIEWTPPLVLCSSEPQQPPRRPGQRPRLGLPPERQRQHLLTTPSLPIMKCFFRRLLTPPHVFASRRPLARPLAPRWSEAGRRILRNNERAEERNLRGNNGEDLEGQGRRRRGDLWQKQPQLHLVNIALNKCGAAWLKSWNSFVEASDLKMLQYNYENTAPFF